MNTDACYFVEIVLDHEAVVISRSMYKDALIISIVCQLLDDSVIGTSAAAICVNVGICLCAVEPQHITMVTK